MTAGIIGMGFRAAGLATLLALGAVLGACCA